MSCVDLIFSVFDVHVVLVCFLVLQTLLILTGLLVSNARVCVCVCGGGGVTSSHLGNRYQ